MPTFIENSKAMPPPPKRVGQYHQPDEDTKWTAHRCDTLIQRLQEHLRSLQQLQGELSFPTSISAPATTGFVERKDEHDPNQDQYDNHFVDHSALKSSRRRNPATYSSKNKSRVFKRPAISNAVASPTCSRPTSYPVSLQLRRVEQDMRTDEFSICRELVLLLSELFKTTIKSTELPTMQFQSLSLACLRVMPMYIVTHGNNTNRLSALLSSNKLLEGAEVDGFSYHELERYTFSHDVWRKLLQLVRTHGTLTIDGAIRRGLLDHRIANVIFRICLQNDYFTEAETILTSLLDSSGVADPVSVHSRPDTVRMLSALTNLRAFYLETGRSSYFRLLGRLFNSGKLCIEWTATHYFSSMWSRLLSRMASDNPGKDAVEMLEVALALLVESSIHSQDTKSGSSMQSAVTETLNNLISSLCFISFQKRRTGTTSPIRSVSTRQGCPIQNVLLSCVIQGFTSYTDAAQYDSLCIAAFAAVLLAPDESTVDQNTLELLALVNKSQQEQPRHVSRMAAFLELLMAEGDKCTTMSTPRFLEHLMRVVDSYSSPRFSHAAPKMQAALSSAINSLASDNRHSEIAEFAARLRKKNEHQRPNSSVAYSVGSCTARKDSGVFMKPSRLHHPNVNFVEDQASGRMIDISAATRPRLVDLIPSSPESVGDNTLGKEIGMARIRDMPSFASLTRNLSSGEFMSESAGNASRKRPQQWPTSKAKRPKASFYSRKVHVTVSYGDDPTLGASVASSMPSPPAGSDDTVLIESSGDELGY